LLQCTPPPLIALHPSNFRRVIAKDNKSWRFRFIEDLAEDDEELLSFIQSRDSVSWEEAYMKTRLLPRWQPTGIIARGENARKVPQPRPNTLHHIESSLGGYSPSGWRRKESVHLHPRRSIFFSGSPRRRDRAPHVRCLLHGDCGDVASSI